MIVVRVPFVEELLKYMLLLASGSPIMILRKSTKLIILTELGNQPLVFVTKIPRSVPKELEAVYRELVHGKFVYLDEKGGIAFSDEVPQNLKPYTGVGMILDIDEMRIGEDGLEMLKNFLYRKKVHKKS